MKQEDDTESLEEGSSTSQSKMGSLMQSISSFKFHDWPETANSA